MMNKTYYSEILNQYLINIDFYQNKKKCIEYSDGKSYNSMSDLYRSKITLLPWGKQPSLEMLEDVCLLNIYPAEEYLFPKNMPPFINQFNKLKILKMPLVYALSLRSDSLPESVEHLILINELKQTNNLGKNKKERIQNLLFPNESFPNIKSLNLITLSSASMIADGYLNINYSRFPNLEFLRCAVNSKDKFLFLESLTNLKHLWVSIGQNVNVFEQIKSPIISLDIDGANVGIEFQKISKIPSLEIIRINSCCDEVDCREFFKLPKLKEIILLNSKGIKNIEALLEMPTLKSLDVLDCKGALTKQQKKIFENNLDKFERLSIDYA